MNSLKILTIFILIFFVYCKEAVAEPYIGFDLGYHFAQKITGTKGNEDLNYPDKPIGIYPNATDPKATLYKDSKDTKLDLKSGISVGIRAGYYFESILCLGT